MTDDRHGEGTPEGGGRWNPLPQGDYDDGATAFVKLPEGGIDALLSGNSPLAAPGHGYVPPRIPGAPAEGGWPAPEGGAAQWPDPNGGQGGGQWPDPDTGQGATQGGDRFTYDPAATQHWNFEEPAPAAPGHDVTGQWSIPVAGGELPDESGEFTTSSLVEQWGGTPPATLPGGAPAPWATNAGQPWGDQGETAQGPDTYGAGEAYGHETYGAEAGAPAEGEAFGPEAGGHAEAYDPGSGEFRAGRAQSTAQGVGSARARRQARAQAAYEQSGAAPGGYEHTGPEQAAQGPAGHGHAGQEQPGAAYGPAAPGQNGPVPGAHEQNGRAPEQNGSAPGAYGQDTLGHDAYEQGGAGEPAVAPGAYDTGVHAPGADARGGYEQGGAERVEAAPGAYDPSGHAPGAHELGGPAQGADAQGVYEQGGADQPGMAPGAHDPAGQAQGAEAQGAYGQGGYERPGQADGAAVPGPDGAGAREHAAHGQDGRHGRDGRIEVPSGRAGHGHPDAGRGQVPQAGHAPSGHPQDSAHPQDGARPQDGAVPGHEQGAHEQLGHEQADHPGSAHPEQAPETGHAQPGGHPAPAHLPAPSGEPSYPFPDGHPAHPRGDAAAEHRTPPAGIPVGPDGHGPATPPVDGPAEHAGQDTAPEAATRPETAPDPAATPAHGTPAPTGDPAVPVVPEQRSGAPVPGVPGQRSDTPVPAPAVPREPAPAHDGDTPIPAPAAVEHADAEPEQAEATEAPEATEEPEPAPLPPHDDHPLASFVLRVNGADRPVTDAWIGESLLYVLRERLGLAGAKDGCSQGECGACNVQVDGRLVASCLVPAVTAAGTEVRTVEGLAQDGHPSDVQRALARCGAVQCGFCVPGMAMTAHDLLEGNPAPTELETRQALCGNLCRCSGYRGVVQAVQEVVAEREAAHAPEPETAADADDARVPHQAGPGSGGAGPSVFEAPGAFDTPPPTPDGYGDTPGPYDQHYGQDGGQA
ncbi:2Fe-2S iron-sulfur cluster-binding protein [Streptomyces murinus]|uniref:2Fe-2S iron-sulfur cluster-binding protein n=1 Tax=Streptomyces murinus TaxID=33900 RepID=UPI0033F0AC80